MRTLVLNSSYEFLGFCDWQSAISAWYTGKVIVEEEYDREVHSPTMTVKIPAVIRLKKYVKVIYDRITYVSYTKFNVFLRDNYTCQYCGLRFSKNYISIDHVIPESRGGQTNWTNTVASCQDCNMNKGARTPEEAGMHLIRVPQRPHGFKEIIRIKIGEIHQLWEKYLL